MKRNVKLLIIIALLTILVAVIFFNLSRTVQFSETVLIADQSELATLSSDFTSYAEFFLETAETNGGVHALELMRRTQFPPNVDQHLLGHVVGDELYRQEGLAGMQYCTDDFRNACSHTIVIGALLENGLSVFDEVNAVCQKAPGGAGAYTMCFHGFGHGVLAYTEYDMEEAVELCMRAGTEFYNYREAYECVGGAVMEMKDGIHDKELWAPQKDRFVDPENPLSLCQADYMNPGAKERCYSYITPFLFDAAGAAGGLPTPDIFADSMAFCELEPDAMYRAMCYRGFGKEFVVLGAAYNIQDFSQLTEDQLSQNLEWCDYASSEEYALGCKQEVLNSLYWGGENDFNISLKYCSIWPTEDVRACYDTLFQNVGFYVGDQPYRESVCEAVPSEYTSYCRNVLNLTSST